MLLYFKSGNYLFFEIGLECQRVPGCYRINRAVPKRYEKGLTIGRTRHFIPPPGSTRGGGGWNPSPAFLICCGILKRFYLYWKAFDLLNKMSYVLWVVALLEACDVTKNGRHLGRHLGLYQESEIRLKLREMLFFVLYMKNNT